MQQRLDVEGVADDRHAFGKAPASVEGVEVIHHKEGVDAIARLLGPYDETLGVHALVALVACLVEQEREGGRGEERVHDVDADLLVRVGLLEAVEAHDGTVVATGKGARDAEEHGRHARLVGGLERLVKLELGGLRGHGHGSVADGVIELMGAARLEEVIVATEAAVGLVGLDVVEGEDGDVALLRLLGGEVAGGVTHDVALYGHGFPLARDGCLRCCILR